MSDLSDWLALASETLVQWKTFAEHSISFSDDALHIFVGVIIQLAAAALLHTTIADSRPWFIVLVLEMLNEALDLTVERWPSFAMQLGESGKDVLLTLALPTLLLIISRLYPHLLVRPPGAVHEVEDETEDSAEV